MPGRHIESGWLCHAPATLPRDKDPFPNLQEEWRSLGLDWTDMGNLTPTLGFEPQTAQPVVIPYTDYTINFSSTLPNYKIYYSSII